MPPPHTTHACQPLDVSVYQPLKSHWSDVCHEFLQKHPARIVTKFDFSELLAEAWSCTMIHKNITSGFRKCGIYPYNPEAIQLPPEVSIQSEVQGNDEDSDKEQENFTSEENVQFQQRFEEGFDMFDPRCFEWLQLNHPEAEIPGGTLYPFDDDMDPEQLSDQELEYNYALTCR